jgi:hypothetical protein
MNVKNTATTTFKGLNKGEAALKALGGLPPVKTVEQISNSYSPSARKKAPGSVRV